VSETDSITQFNLLTQYFQGMSFKAIPTDIATVSMFATYQKSSLYLINILVLDEDYVFDDERYQLFLETTRNRFAKVRTDKVILLNIMITPNPKSVYDHVNYRPNLEEDFVDIHWIVDSDKKELVIPGLQIKSVLGFEKAILELVTTGKHEFYQLTRQREPSHISFLFIFVLCGLWVFLEFQGGSTNTNVLMKYGALNVTYILSTGQYWRLFTAMFLHIGFAHLAFNVFALYIFGSRLEKYVNTMTYVTIFIVAGLSGSLFSFLGSYLLGTSSVSAGASGAIYGLLGAVLVLANASKQPIEGLDSYTMWLVFIFGMVYSVVARNVDALAHVGGFIGGLMASVPVVLREKKRLGGMTDEKR
jgi:rhomboid protease GluP